MTYLVWGLLFTSLGLLATPVVAYFRPKRRLTKSDVDLALSIIFIHLAVCFALCWKVLT